MPPQRGIGATAPVNSARKGLAAAHPAPRSQGASHWSRRTENPDIASSMVLLVPTGVAARRALANGRGQGLTARGWGYTGRILRELQCHRHTRQQEHDRRRPLQLLGKVDAIVRFFRLCEAA